MITVSPRQIIFAGVAAGTMMTATPALAESDCVLYGQITMEKDGKEYVVPFEGYPLKEGEYQLPTQENWDEDDIKKNVKKIVKDVAFEEVRSRESKGWTIVWDKTTFHIEDTEKLVKAKLVRVTADCNISSTPLDTIVFDLPFAPEPTPPVKVTKKPRPRIVPPPPEVIARPLEAGNPLERFRVFFPFDKSYLTLQAKDKLLDFAKRAKALNLTSVNIAFAGHTDTMGTEHYNEGLAARRATTVRDFLTRVMHLPARAITAVKVCGEKALRVLTPDERAHPENRRVEGGAYAAGNVEKVLSAAEQSCATESGQGVRTTPEAKPRPKKAAKVKPSSRRMPVAAVIAHPLMADQPQIDPVVVRFAPSSVKLENATNSAAVDGVISPVQAGEGNLRVVFSAVDNYATFRARWDSIKERLKEWEFPLDRVERRICADRGPGHPDHDVRFEYAFDKRKPLNCNFAAKPQ